MVTPRSTSTPSPKKKMSTVASSWERVKHAFERDWLQTRADFTEGGRDLNQDVTDTVRQAVGTQPIPADGEPNARDSKHDWFTAEPAVRYGFAAFEEYGARYPTWNDELERKLERGWNEKATGLRFQDVRHEVKVGWHTRH